MLRAETWLTVYRTIAIEWEYSSFSKSNTETVAKPGRLGPAQNGKLVTDFGRVDKVLLDDLQENPKKTLSSVC